ncbi:MAG TPA: DUF1343 domain-containing protein [Opitutaceae bacterium]|jgi:uncharacterized protein YbbC (DUF1343 family)
MALARLLRPALFLAVPLAGLVGCSATPPPAPPAPRMMPAPVAVAPLPAPVVRRDLPDSAHPVMLGIDVLESDGFAEVRGKSIGLLTHPAGVDMRGLSTIDLLRHAPGVRLRCLFAPEHGVRGDFPASANVPERVDAATGLMVHSIYHGNLTKPTRLQLKGLDAVVIDLQDIGSRSYTFVSAMKTCMEGCFEAGVQVIVLDRPNPLGGLKVDGPPLDTQWMSNVGSFRVPYVHGLTIGEFAHMAKEAPDILRISETARLNGRLTIIPMRGWRRSMRWPETGLRWVPTSHYIPDFSAVEGYPMTGPGCERGGFKNGIGTAYPFRGLSYHGVRIETLERDLKALALPGIGFRRVSVPDPKTGAPELGLYVEITDWDLWRPTELSAYLMRLACKYGVRNPFANLTPAEFRSLAIYWGSAPFLNELAAHGARADVAAFIADWQVKAVVYQQQVRRYWLYH